MTSSQSWKTRKSVNRSFFPPTELYIFGCETGSPAIEYGGSQIYQCNGTYMPPGECHNAPKK